MPVGPVIAETAPGTTETVTDSTAANIAVEFRPVRIAVFSDHPVFRSTLSWKLGEDSGIEVIADAPSLHETLALIDSLSSGSVDAVIADLRVGDGNSEGIESVRRLVENRLNVPVLVCSDLYSRSYASRMREVGAVAMVQKSVSITSLAAVILDAVSRSRTGADSPAQTGRTSAA